MAEPKYVLVVDDDGDVRKLLRDVLKTLNIETGEAADGQEAIKAIKERRPDLIILDLMMPVMDGFTFITRTQGKTGPLNPASNIPIILLSAIADTQSHMKNLPGVVGTIRKGNISLLEVTGLITTTLGVDNGFVRQSEEVARKNAEADAKAAAEAQAKAEAEGKEPEAPKAEAAAEKTETKADTKAESDKPSAEVQPEAKPTAAKQASPEAALSSTHDKDTPPFELPAAEKAVAGSTEAEKKPDSPDTK